MGHSSLLSRIAWRTGEYNVAHIIATAMLQWDHMINVIRIFAFYESYLAVIALALLPLQLFLYLGWSVAPGRVHQPSSSPESFYTMGHFTALSLEILLTIRPSLFATLDPRLSISFFFLFRVIGLIYLSFFAVLFGKPPVTLKDILLMFFLPLHTLKPLLFTVRGALQFPANIAARPQSVAMGSIPGEIKVGQYLLAHTTLFAWLVILRYSIVHDRSNLSVITPSDVSASRGQNHVHLSSSLYHKPAPQASLRPLLY